MKTLRSMQAAVVFAAALLLGVTHSAWATSASDTSDNIQVTVASVLSITDEFTGPIVLTFSADGSATGSLSSGQTVGYIVNANTMQLAALNSALTAKLSAPVTNVDIRGSTAADAYVNAGTGSNAILVPFNTSAASPTVIGTSDTRMFDKPTSSGNPGKVLKGTAYINWNAKATADLVPGDGGVVTLTVTLKDA